MNTSCEGTVFQVEKITFYRCLLEGRIFRVAQFAPTMCPICSRPVNASEGEVEEKKMLVRVRFESGEVSGLWELPR